MDEQSWLTFACNICGASSTVPRSQLGRETPSCGGCGSTVRFRAVVHVLSCALFERSIPLPDFPRRPDIAGRGLSDWEGYAAGLAAKLAYENTYHRREPFLDITRTPGELEGTLDFLIASDVLEHVPPPIERAFESAYRLLAPGGTLVLTVPYAPGRGPTLEHFPELDRYEFAFFQGKPILVNRTRDGRWQVFDQLVFHGGIDEVAVEMRRFSRSSLYACLEAAGFERIEERGEDCEELGIVWPEQVSLPIVARRSALSGPS